MPANGNPNATCPNCGKSLDSFTHARPGVRHAAEGDLSICVYCGVVLIFRADLTLRLPTAAEAPAVIKSIDAWLLEQRRGPVQ